MNNHIPSANIVLFFFQFNKPLSPWTVSRLMPISKSIFRFLFWAFAYEFSMHYLYNSAMIHKASLLENLPLWSMASIGYMSGQFFMVKYLVIWSMFSAMARLDQLVTPQVPSCISHIYLYSEIWKWVLIFFIKLIFNSLVWRKLLHKIDFNLNLLIPRKNLN